MAQRPLLPPTPPPPPPPPPSLSGVTAERQEQQQARPQQRAAGATLSGAGLADPAWGYVLTYACAPGTFASTRAACQTLADAVTQEQAPRTGVVTYAFTCALDEDAGDEGPGQEPRRISMLELFADTDSFSTHLTENEGEAMVEMFQTSLQLVPGGATVFNCDENDKALHAGLVFTAGVADEEVTDAERRAATIALGDQSTRFVWPKAGKVLNAQALNNKHMQRFPALRPSGNTSVAMEIRADTETSKSGEAVKEALCKAIPQHDGAFVSCFVCDAWWPGAGQHAVGMHLLVAAPGSVKAVMYRSKLAAALEAAGGCLKLVVTAQNWQDDELLDLIEFFSDSHIPLVERRMLFAGFLIHPAFCQPWHQRIAEDTAEQTAAAAARESEAGATPEASSKPRSERFSIRRHAVTNAAQAIVLAPEQAQAAHARDQLVVPLPQVLHKLCRLGRADRELPIGMVYAQLNRLRVLVRDADTLNSVTDEAIEGDQALAMRMQLLLDQLTALGYSLPAHGRVPLRFGAVPLQQNRFVWRWFVTMTDHLT